MNNSTLRPNLERTIENEKDFEKDSLNYPCKFVFEL